MLLCKRHHARWDRGHRLIAPCNGAPSGLHVILAELLDQDGETTPPPHTADA